MKKVDCILRPYKLEEVKTALSELGITGMTVTDVRGTGRSTTARETIGTDYVIRLPVRLRIEMIVPDDLVEPIIETVLKHTQTGQPDDGKIFVYPIEDAIRIRTEEHGNDAI